ncbi:MAG: amidase [Solirubrobacterales bacterium]|nr:amidase [Solirubrobacterales bacterium]
MSDDLARMDATAQAELVESGDATPVELLEAALERAAQVNPEINAIIHDLADEAREQAAADVPDGPFKGVPFLLKDLGAAYAGQPLHMGMRLLKEADFRAPVDTFLADRFRAAGLITFGKTNTPELGILPTSEPEAYGPSKNPWDTTRTPGGSSGGSAAAVAAGIVPMAHANDGGGSIRIPASNCGLVGLKPTRQRITEGPLVGDNFSGLTCELVVSRSVRDTARILDAVEGSAPGDPYVAPAPLRPYVEELTDESTGLRIGTMTQPAVASDVDPECVAAVEVAARILSDLGHEVDDSSPLDLMPQGDEEAGMQIQDSFLTRWGAGQAALISQMEMLIGREITPDDVEPLTWALTEIGRDRTSGRYLADVALHHGVSRLIAGWYAGGHDLLLTPTMAEVAPKLGSFDQHGDNPMDAFHRAFPSGAFTALFNITGQPAISLPLHWTEDGVPVGAQLVAPFGREDLLLRVAAQVERAAPWADRIPPVFAGAVAGDAA